MRIGNLERETHGRSATLKRFCDAWINRMAEYRKAVPEDWWPFEYGERSLVGFFAAGIWDVNGVCIEEFQSHDKVRMRDGKKEKFRGRGDLYVRHGKTESNIEFKVRQIGLSKRGDHEETVRKHWRASQKDARRSHQTGINTFAGIFVLPYVRDGTAVKTCEENLRQLLRCVWDTVKPDAMAWWCPIKDALKNEWGWDDPVVGVILVVKSVRSA